MKVRVDEASHRSANAASVRSLRETDKSLVRELNRCGLNEIEQVVDASLGPLSQTRTWKANSRLVEQG